MNNELRQQLQKIEPSSDGMMKYFPCMVVLSTGKQFDRVYLAEADSYIKIWGVWPDDDQGKRFIRVEDVASIHPSPYRLPSQLAQKMYKAGESGMGYCVFTLEFRDGFAQAYLCGNAIDFVSLPAGKTMADVIDLIPHKGRNGQQMQKLDYWWCFFSMEQK
ncbi:MAG TPA: hypothetical protein VMD27_03900 [Candidatus Aquilonibacter sp.]|nr:hypothetical protein [Candidatus Aquilonibacter sp.]